MAARPPSGHGPLPTRVQGLPDLPSAFRDTLDRGLPAIAGLTPTAEQIERLTGHVRLLVAWNMAVNLSGIREPGAIAREHVLDSLAAVPMLRRAGVDELLDLGSGGGFPGLPLAIGLPAAHALLVDSVGKKARFLATVVEALGLADRVRVAPARAEELAADPRQRGHWPAVVARAVADLAELTELGLPLLRPGGILVAWKRRPAEDELRRAGPVLAAVGGRIAAVESVVVPGLEDHVLVVVEKVSPTPARYPREPAARRRWRR